MCAAQYVTWSGCKDKDCFFVDPKARELFQNHLTTVVNRVNTLTGVAYKNDPTIFAWDLMNEPRCDCFPARIPPSEADGSSCQPICVDKMQVPFSPCLPPCLLSF